MKMVQAIIRPEKMAKTRKALEEKGFGPMSILEIPGGGEQRGIAPSRQEETVKVDTLPKVMLMMVVSDHDVDTIVSIIRAGERAGSHGEGKIFVI